MQAFVCFLISCNIGEIATMFIATILGLPEPLTPLHLLWVNLVTDGPPATALGFNPSDPDAMKKLPRLKSESILTKWFVLTHSPTRSLTHLLTYLLTYSLTHSLTYLLTHSLTHSLTGCVFDTSSLVCMLAALPSGHTYGGTSIKESLSIN
jgi:magnesium-transporting ATPase (P-type)